MIFHAVINKISSRKISGHEIAWPWNLKRRETLALMLTIINVAILHGHREKHHGRSNFRYKEHDAKKGNSNGDFRKGTNLSSGDNYSLGSGSPPSPRGTTFQEANLKIDSGKWEPAFLG